jgi:hypothetical protein
VSIIGQEKSGLNNDTDDDENKTMAQNKTTQPAAAGRVHHAEFRPSEQTGDSLNLFHTDT